MSDSLDASRVLIGRFSIDRVFEKTGFLIIKREDETEERSIPLSISAGGNTSLSFSLISSFIFVTGSNVTLRLEPGEYHFFFLLDKEAVTLPEEQSFTDFHSGSTYNIMIVETVLQKGPLLFIRVTSPPSSLTRSTTSLSNLRNSQYHGASFPRHQIRTRSYRSQSESWRCP